MHGSEERMSPPAWTIEGEHLQAAKRVMARYPLKTPLVPSGAALPHVEDVWFKLENEQLTGSFKVRGALTRVLALSEDERQRGVVAASAGNHGLGLAYAASKLGVSARVYVPKGTPDIKRLGIARLGAEVRVCPQEGYDAAEDMARKAATDEQRVFVSPYDDPYVAAGNGGMLGFEVLGAVPNVRNIVLPVGGGGLLNGMSAALRVRGLEDQVRLIGVQSEVSSAMTDSLKTGVTVENLPGVSTLAEGLEGGVSPTSHAHASRSGVEMHTVSEAEIAQSIRHAYHATGLVLEGSAAVGLAWAMRHASDLEGRTVVVLTGQNIDPKKHQEILAGPIGD